MVKKTDDQIRSKYGIKDPNFEHPNRVQVKPTDSSKPEFEADLTYKQGLVQEPEAKKLDDSVFALAKVVENEKLNSTYPTSENGKVMGIVNGEVVPVESGSNVYQVELTTSNTTGYNFNESKTAILITFSFDFKTEILKYIGKNYRLDISVFTGIVQHFSVNLLNFVDWQNSSVIGIAKMQSGSTNDVQQFSFNDWNRLDIYSSSPFTVLKTKITIVKL